MRESSPGVVADNATRALRTGGAGVLDRPPSEEFDTPTERFRPGQKLLSYELGARIGVGGMGAVYRATHFWLGRQVAIKFITPELMSEPETVARFAHEARAIGALDHPNIVRATDAGRVGNTHFLVTEFVEGMDLAQLVKRRGPLGVAEACEVVRQAALGLQHANEQGLVHRDVKPSNLLVDRRGNVKIVDFGIARLIAGQTTLTGTGQMLGTLDYLAPEQANDARKVSIRSDIYSLGCTLYFLLSGTPPFSGQAYETPASKIKAHLVDTPPPPQARGPKLPQGVLDCLEQMMSKSPDDRPTTPAEVAKALTPFCRGARLPALIAGELPHLPATTRSSAGASFFRRLFGIPVRIWGHSSRKRSQKPADAPTRSGASSLSPLLWVVGFVIFGWALLKSGAVPIVVVDEFGRVVEPEAEISRIAIGPDGSMHLAPPRGPHIENPALRRPPPDKPQ